jgi:hypothetical protein
MKKKKKSLLGSKESDSLGQNSFLFNTPAIKPLFPFSIKGKRSLDSDPKG